MAIMHTYDKGDWGLLFRIPVQKLRHMALPRSPATRIFFGLGNPTGIPLTPSCSSFQQYLITYMAIHFNLDLYKRKCLEHRGWLLII